MKRIEEVNLLQNKEYYLINLFLLVIERYSLNYFYSLDVCSDGSYKLYEHTKSNRSSTLLGSYSFFGLIQELRGLTNYFTKSNN